MSPHKHLFWLASYPKSGNTWFRIVLANLLNPDAADPLNHMDDILGSGMTANRSWLNKMLGFDSRLLNHTELEQARQAGHRLITTRNAQNCYIKAHDAYTFLEDKTPLFPAESCTAALYFIRNPLDVAVSMAHHVRCPLDWSIEMMGHAHFSIPFPAFQNIQVPQKLLSWSQHVQSWTMDAAFKVLVLRYEDMLENPLDTFQKGIDFLKLRFSPDALDQALRNASFNRLQNQEISAGFKEKPHPDQLFFREGKSGEWKKILTKKQADKIYFDHGHVMRAFGY